ARHGSDLMDGERAHAPGIAGNSWRRCAALHGPRASVSEQTSLGRQDIIAHYRQNPRAPGMRIFGAFVIFLAAAYVWDAQYNNGVLTDAVRGMGRSIAHSMVR